MSLLAIPALLGAAAMASLGGGVASISMGLVGIALCGWHAVFRAPYQPVSRRMRLGVPASWPHLSLLHISDLHVRREDPRLARVQMRALAGVAPDVLCVTGDVCEKADDVGQLVEVLRSARPRLGTFIILGNHEHGAHLPRHLQDRGGRTLHRLIDRCLAPFSPSRRSDGPEEGHAIGAALQSAGFTVLHNEGVRVATPGGSVWIAGCDSAWAGHADMTAAMDGRGPSEPCLALIHEPELAFAAAAQGADLILAGHTHGGQVRLPVVGAPHTHRVDKRVRIASGFQRIGRAWLHITTGLGHTIPLRVGCPPEIVWLDCIPTAVLERLPSDVQNRVAA